MKTILQKTSKLVILALLVNLKGFTQIQNSTLVAKFGLDGDMYSDYRLNGTFNAAGSHDWFKTANGTGKGLIDTTGAAFYKTHLSNAANISFGMESGLPQYSAVDSILHMDAIYLRDFQDNDRTSFTQGSKNGDDPTSWISTPNGAMVQSKSDIIDIYASMRRNGLSLNSANPSPIIMTMGATILGTTGVRYVDFELFVNKFNYDSISGKFTNSGLATKGGHEDFQFNPDGSVKKFGDVDIAFAYNSASVSQIDIYIWVSAATYNNTYGMKKFNFVPGEFYGNGNNPAWGYAKIIAKTGFVFPLWGVVNSANIAGPVWGSASKDLGTTSNNYFSMSNSMGQFSEVAIDLTALGIDPLLNSISVNGCNPPFNKIMVKTRASASFTAALVDFTGPYKFLEAPVANAKPAIPLPLTCNRASVNLKPEQIESSRSYFWSTNDGNIVSRADSGVVTVNKPGKYYLITIADFGCVESKDSVIVATDYYKPIAAASAIGIINQTFTNTAQLIGGDVALSNFNTPFGRSLGLQWNWSNTNGFTSAIQNPVTSDTGFYQLIVTEIRNGCKDTALTSVLYNFNPLPVRFGILTAVKTSNQKVALKWTTQTEDGNEVYELERSTNAANFEKVYTTNATGMNYNATYQYNDNINFILSTYVYYRVKIQMASGRYFYSPVAKVINKSGQNDNYLIAAYQQAAGTIQVNYFTKNSSKVDIRVIDMNGKIITKYTTQSQDGNNNVQLNSINNSIRSQMVIVQTIIDGEIFSNKIMIF